VVDHLVLDAVPVDVLHEITQQLEEPEGVVGKDLLILQVHRRGEEAEIVQDVLEHQLLAPLIHLIDEFGIEFELAVEDLLGEGDKLGFDARKKQTHEVPPTKNSLVSIPVKGGDGYLYRQGVCFLAVAPCRSKNWTLRLETFRCSTIAWWTAFASRLSNA